MGELPTQSDWVGDSLKDIYLPSKERDIKRLRQTSERINIECRSWAKMVTDLLPEELGLHIDEKYLLSLFLAEQHRLNIQLDIKRGDQHGIRRLLPIFGAKDKPQILDAAHTMVRVRFESEIERTYNTGCCHNQINPNSEVAIDWRAAIRLMAQNLEGVAWRAKSPDKIQEDSQLRFEFKQIARERASGITAKRLGLKQLS